MRKWIRMMIITGILCLLISCTPAPSVSLVNVDYQSLGIDTAQYDEAAAARINRRNQEFFSIPGMVLFTNEGNATANWRLYYYNKATDTADIFCFDPLCNHKSYDKCPYLWLKYSLNFFGITTDEDGGLVM